MKQSFKELAAQYREELFGSVLPFWMEKSPDTECGGYFTCLDRYGNVYDTDKFVWLQGREVWMFSMLYNKVEKNPEWLECAIKGAEFLKKYGHDGNYNWYFSLTRDGQPLVEPYNIFSYTFAAMAFGQLSIATGNKEYADIAKKTFDIVLSRADNPKAKWNKAHPGTRDLKNFALPMILCNLALEIEPLLDPEYLNSTIETCLHEVLDVFYRPELGIVVENVTADNQLSDTFDGRHLNPGHVVLHGPRSAPRASRRNRQSRRHHTDNAEIRLGRAIRRHLLFHGPQRLPSTRTRMGSETLVGAHGNTHLAA